MLSCAGIVAKPDLVRITVDRRCTGGPRETGLHMLGMKSGDRVRRNEIIALNQHRRHGDRGGAAVDCDQPVHVTGTVTDSRVSGCF
jgi:hypothetical protein